MKRSMKAGLFLALVAVIGVWLVSPVIAQEKQADTMQLVRDKVKADKKLFIATNMGLTESEAKGFWPVYEAYQKELTAIHERIGKLIKSYAEDYRAKSLNDEKAKKLTDELVSIQKAEGGLQASYVPKLGKVLPAMKVARYLQIENKIQAALKYELAANIPVVQ